MDVLDQADACCNDVDGDRDSAGDVLVTGLGVVAFLGDRTDDVDAARADQAGGTALRQVCPEVVCNAVVLDHGAIMVGAAVQAWAVAVGGNGIAEQASEDHAVGHLAAGGKQQHLFVFGGRVPAPARQVIHGNQVVRLPPVCTFTRGGLCCTSAMVPKRIRFSSKRFRPAMFMPAMVA